MITCESVSTATDALCPFEPLAAAFVPMAHLGVVDRHYTVPAHSLLQPHPLFGALDILKQQLPQQFGRFHYPLALSAVLVQ